MRILVANIPLPQNRFLVDLNAALSCHADVVHDHEAFWECRGQFDVVHLHFPEYLTYEIEQAYHRGLDGNLIAEVEQRLSYWAARSKLVVTRHVLLPHDARHDPAWEQLYETTYRYADGVVHFAPPSVTEFKQRYAATIFNRGMPAHALIPHHNYASLPNTIDRTRARQQLGISQHARVVLLFGAIRSDDERQLALDGFRGLRDPHKVLLVSRWRERLARVRWIRLKYWLRDAVRLYYRLHPRYRFNYDFVPEDEAQLYLNAADVLLIPRRHVLNSGNVTLGMTFGRVVVGPDSLDVGHLLRETGNPVFDPDRPDTVALALRRGLQLAGEGRVGAANRELALGEWSVNRCAEDYIRFFLKVRANRQSTNAAQAL